MSIFILVAIVFLLMLFALALKPLWRSQRVFAAGAVLFSILFTGALYWQLGKFEAITYQAPVSAEPSIEQALQELSDLVRKEPENLEARLMLARSLMVLNKPAEAQAHFEAALIQEPANTGLMVDYAESIFRSSPAKNPDARAQKLIDQALALEPGNTRAGFFKGVLQMQAGQPAKAADTWQGLLPLVDASTAQALLPQINRARTEAGLPAMAMPDVRRVRITVDVDPALRAQQAPGAVLFVFAKAANGQGPPIAAKRLPVTAFPIQIELSDGDSVMPTATLFSQTAFTVHARLSASGSAEHTAGDWQAEPVLMQSDSLAPLTLTLRRMP